MRGAHAESAAVEHCIACMLPCVDHDVCVAALHRHRDLSLDRHAPLISGHQARHRMSEAHNRLMNLRALSWNPPYVYSTKGTNSHAKPLASSSYLSCFTASAGGGVEVMIERSALTGPAAA